MPRMVRYGLSQLPSLLRDLGVTKPLLVSSRRWLDTAAPYLASFPSYAVFSSFEPNPDFDQCASGLCMLERKGCDGLVAIGGGSTMDTAKTILAMHMSPSPSQALAMQYDTASCLPLILIPTTAGSGSEATQTAVVYVDGRKYSLSHPALLSLGVILDASLLRTLPAPMRRSCALDALCQAIESFWSRSATQESRAIAGPAAKGILHTFSSYMSGDENAEKDMLRLSYEAGEAIQLTRTTAAHAMSYQLTKLLGIPHGDACALTLPWLWQRMTDTPVTRELSRVLGIRTEEGPDLFRQLCRTYGLLPPGVPSEKILDALTDSVNTERLGNHPEPLSRQDIREIYIQALTAPETERNEADA